MKKQYKIGMAIIILILITQLLNMQVNYNNNTKNYIRMSYSREWRLLHLNIEQLENAIEENINADEEGKNNEEIKKIIREISYINDSLIGYTRLNKKYGLSIYSMLDLLKPIESKIDRDETLTGEDLLIVRKIVALNENYSIIKSPSLYKRNANRFKSMNLPTEVIEYVNELENLVQAFDLQ